MKIYLVGGAIRDKLLGRNVSERDWVVVGATPDDLLSKGFKPVGKDFPVFLHPETSEEYALARTERKTARGYHGFAFHYAPDVTLEADLSRRDLTINAMAEDSDGTLIDPYGGQADLQARILRHVSPAFAEDPVRILRLARFYARYGYLGFQVADETMQLMRTMVQTGEVNALVPDRVWQEMERTFSELNPEKFFELLHAIGALSILFPELNPLFDSAHTEQRVVDVLKVTSQQKYAPATRFAALLISAKIAAVNVLTQRYPIPKVFSDLARLSIRHYDTIIGAKELSTEQILLLFEQADAFRRPERFQELLRACDADAIAQDPMAEIVTSYLLSLLQGCREVTVADLDISGLKGDEIARRIRQARCEKIEGYR